MPIPGVEMLAGAAVGYLIRKARRVGGRADAEVDRVLDEGMDAIHELVSGVVGDDPAVARVQEQARTGEETDRGRRRAADAIADAMEDDPDFATALTALVDRLERHEAEGAPRAGRDVTVQHAETGGVNVTGGVTGGVRTTGAVDPTSPDPNA
jgi:hypothetical protein